ncbi:MAG: hypothetical protein JKY61_11175 [Planctomycetes bacterium]|nr:hypothetical protein [Planctomycetota bacterium]
MFSLYTIVVTASKSIPGFDPFGGLTIIGGEILMLSFLLGAHWGLRFLSGAGTRFSVLLGVLYGLTAWSKTSVAEAAIFWGVVAIYVHAIFVLRKVRAIQDAHPEVLESQGGESKVTRKSRHHYVEEQKVWQHVLAYILLLVAGGLMLFGDRAGTPDEKVLRNLFGAWNGNDKQAVAALSGDMSEEFYLEKLNEMDRERKWGGALPHMQSAKIYRPNDKLLAADLTGSQGGLKVRFFFRKERWLLVALEYMPEP